MEFSSDVLSQCEKAIMCLRSLYRQYGYTQYKMSRFEEYGLYADNKAFLSSGDIVTFTGTGGRLMALRPDVTLSIAKNTKEDASLKKLIIMRTSTVPTAMSSGNRCRSGWNASATSTSR